jgi:hypothetical protein
LLLFVLSGKFWKDQKTTRITYIVCTLQKWHKQNNIQWSAALCDHVDIRFDLIFNAIRKGGGLYLYLNQRGCDGEHLFYDGGACIICNGTVVAQAKQFSLSDIDDFCSYFASIPSFGVQSATQTNNK